MENRADPMTASRHPWRQRLTAVSLLALAAGAAWLAAGWATDRIEAQARADASAALAAGGFDWARAEADGLSLILTGTAPDEVQRYRAVSTAGMVVDAGRIVDRTRIAPQTTIAPPPFRLEILRHDQGVSVIGLAPATLDRRAMLARLGGEGRGGGAAAVASATPPASATPSAPATGTPQNPTPHPATATPPAAPPATGAPLAPAAPPTQATTAPPDSATATPPAATPATGTPLAPATTSAQATAVPPSTATATSPTPSTQPDHTPPAITDLVDLADYPAPPHWDAAVEFALTAASLVPRGKISVGLEGVQVAAVTDGPAEKARLEQALQAARPDGVALTTEITAPRPVIAPFVLALDKSGGGLRMTACAADTAAARDRIAAALADAGLPGQPDCTLGLGAPSPQWADAAVPVIAALAALPAGRAEIRDTDVTLTAPALVPQGQFAAARDGLRAALPRLFTLTATLERAQIGAPPGPAAFSASKAPEGVTLDGSIADDRMRGAVESFAVARFGQTGGDLAVNPALPAGWSLRVIGALDALAALDRGTAEMTPDLIRISGTTGDRNAAQTLAATLAARIGAGADYELSLRYDPRLDPSLDLPSGTDCVDRLNETMQQSEIGFEPNRAVIAGDPAETLARLGTIMSECADFRLEIGGHTDSQGSDSFNMTLSHDRAKAVATAMADAGIAAANLTVTGYGETRPVGDNATEAGREMNRRIEFRLLSPDPVNATAGPVTVTRGTTREGGVDVAQGEGGADAAAPAGATDQAADAGAANRSGRPTGVEAAAQAGNEPAETGSVDDAEPGGTEAATTGAGVAASSDDAPEAALSPDAAEAAASDSASASGPAEVASPDRAPPTAAADAAAPDDASAPDSASDSAAPAAPSDSAAPAPVSASPALPDSASADTAAAETLTPATAGPDAASPVEASAPPAAATSSAPVSAHMPAPAAPLRPGALQSGRLTGLPPDLGGEAAPELPAPPAAPATDNPEADALTPDEAAAAEGILIRPDAPQVIGDRLLTPVPPVLPTGIPAAPPADPGPARPAPRPEG